MLARHRRSRPRPRRLARHRIGLWAEHLEARRLLATIPINVAANLPIASGLPLPGLATGLGLPGTTQTLPSSTATVAPASVAPATINAPFAETPTGPATTLSPLMTDFETANAPASEFAHPTPGTSDRISVILQAPETLPIPHLRVSDPIAVIPGPELETPSTTPPIEPPAPNTLLPIQSQEADPSMPPKPALAAPQDQEATSLEVWDATLAMVATEAAAETTMPLSARTEATLAAGVMLAAWTGWKYRPRTTGQSRRRPLTIEAAGLIPDGLPVR